MSATDQPSEAELRAAYEAELKQIRVEQILLEQVITLVNMGMRRTGLAPGTEDERDPAQVRVAIESVRALMPVLEQVAPPQVQPIREALSQLQMAYVRVGGGGEMPASPPASETAAPAAPGAGRPGSDPAQPGGAAAPGGQPPGGPTPGGAPPEPGAPGDPGPAQRSGRLWIPGQ